MLNFYTVSFFGHRHIDNVFDVERNLEEIISELLRKKEYVEFLVGRDGEFDLLVSSTVKRCKNRMGDHNSALVWVLPYPTAEFRDYEEGFRLKNCSKRVIPLRHVVFTIQVISLIFSVFHRAMPQPVAVVTYCLGAFTAPYLMLSYGCRYLSSAKWWSWECIPFVLETAFSVLYAGAITLHSRLRIVSFWSFVLSGMSIMNWKSATMVC